MATFKGNGALTGMVGNLVIANYKNGKTVLRKAPRERKFTEKQKQNWQRFSAVTAFWKSFQGSQIQQIWKFAEEGRRGINLFINANAPAFSAEGVITDPDRLHFSVGKLPLPHNLTAQRVTGNPDKLEVTWKNDEGTGLARPDDELTMMAGNIEAPFRGLETPKGLILIPTGAIRRQGSAVIQLPSADVQSVWLWFASEKRKLWSGNQYFGI
jgi:hypothetical protein